MHVLLASWPLFHRVGGVILSRWAHFLAGITWIGILYYFNFVQVPSFAGFDAGARNEATAKLVPRALWWFRWGAMLTLLSGISILAFQDQFNGDYWKTPSGVSIATGILLALVMFSNVWFVIWPAQQVVMASSSFWPFFGSTEFLASPASLVAVQNSSWRSGYFFKCSGLK